MHFARGRNASLIAITDGPLSPLHACADLCLSARSDMASFVDSMAAPMSLINALIVAVGQRRRSEVGSFFQEMEEVWNQYDVYLKKGET
jgi:DNA-binding MurR/RpiR family transcriptional regulator